MELFNPYNDLIVRAVPFIFNYLIEKREIDKYTLSNFFKRTINEDKHFDVKEFLSDDTHIKSIIIEPTHENKFLIKSDGKYELSDYCWENPLPIAFSKHEKEYIKLMLDDPEARSFLSGELIEKLGSALENYDVSHISNNYIEREVIKNETDENALRSNLLIITDALRNNKKIECVYEDLNKSYEGTASPYKLMYSLRERALKLAACPDNSPDGFILMNIDCFKSVNISETDSGATSDEFNSPQVIRLILEVENNKDLKSAERCMRIFSSYKKTTVYDKGKNIFYIEIDFYPFDKPFVIKDIISLGSKVKVVGVKKSEKKGEFNNDEKLFQEMREEIIEIITKMYNNMC